MASVTQRSYRQPGRLIPPSARRLKSRSVRLSPGQEIGWHSTDDREELILVIRGAVSLQMRDRRRSISLSAGRAVFIPAGAWHRVVNHSRRQAHYVYVTA
ncbi:MAG: cupin domain-containing protein [Candidatus Omnitrophica bacterium]|nr:cupin domain-containing protein [Candidatus Omnitrophota bacterium]